MRTVGAAGDNVRVSAAGGRSRGALLGLLLLCLAVVVGLLLVQGGGTEGEAAPAPQPSSVPAAPGPAGPLPTTVGAEAPTQTPVSGLATTAESDLPPEARDTLGLIRAGGPFPYRQDDETFFNREEILPDRPRGYYREYTVPTRGSPDRGARRIVAGEAGDLYYTADHYDSFEQIEVGS